MATTFTASNRLNDLLQGDPGTRDNWGTPNSENMVLVDSALDGLAQVNIAGLTNFTLSANSGQPDQARERMQSYTGALTGACTVTVPNVQKWGYARNVTTGGQNVVLSAGAGTTMTLPPDSFWYLYWTDGATNVSGLALGLGSLSVGNLTAANVSASGNLTAAGNLAVTGTTTLTGALTAPTISGPVAFDSTISLPNNVNITMADSLNAQRNVLNLSAANIVTLTNAGNAGWQLVNNTNTRTLVGIDSNGSITVNGNASGQDCTVALEANTSGKAGVTVNSLPVPAHNYTSFISNIVNTSCFHAIWQFQGAVAGSITAGAGPSTSYNTTSDATLKLDDGAIDDPGRMIDRLKPRWFRWKDAPDADSQPGFFAQQVHRVFPWAVTKGSRGKPWQMDNSKLVPLLVAELQSLRRRLRELERCRSDR